METSRTFSNVLEHFQKKRKNFVANLIQFGINTYPPIVYTIIANNQNKYQTKRQILFIKPTTNNNLFLQSNEPVRVFAFNTKKIFI
jgi:hypothetical protein